MLKSTSTVLTADARIIEGGCYLHTLVVLASADGGDVSLYDGLDATSGQLIITAKGEGNISKPITFNPPRFCNNGLYCDIGSNITNATIHYSPATGEDIMNV